MPPKEEDADAAVRFAHAAAALASEAVLTVARLDPGASPSPAASRALQLASEQAELLERLAREGAPLREAYQAAATALEAAAEALAATKPRPWVHLIRARPRSEETGEGTGSA
ncbi:MAG TPA: hypothetical protein VHH36_03110 [Candidatus Thermoplasmatota archaeon]|nr:hypothetical protein [Candidatus Thermoplasmatota archaeon]